MRHRAVFALLILLGMGSIGAYYWMKESSYDGYFPLALVTEEKIPAVTVTIEDQEYFLKLCTGSYIDIQLAPHLIRSLKKELVRMETIQNEIGEQHRLMVHRFPLVGMGHLEIINPEVFEEKNSEDIGMNQSDSLKIGSIGRGILSKMNLFLDISRRSMFFCSDLKMRKKDGYILTRFVAIPMEKTDSKDIVLTFETDLGQKKFLISTSSVYTFIRSSEIGERSTTPITIEDKIERQYYCHHLKIQNNDFGGLNLILHDIDPAIDLFNGILGLDFLKNHVLYFDFSNQLIYIAKATDCKE